MAEARASEFTTKITKGTKMDGREIFKAFKKFEDRNPATFSDAASGTYLRNRLEKAFQAGIVAAESSRDEVVKLIELIQQKLKVIEEYSAWQIHADQRFKPGQRVEFSRKAIERIGPGKLSVTKGRIVEIQDAFGVTVQLDGCKQPGSYHHSFFNPVRGPKLF